MTDDDERKKRFPKPPAHVAPYVDVLGVDGAVEFLLAFGGAELYLATSPKGRSRLAQLVGVEKAAELAHAAEHLPRRVPTAKPWIAQVFKSRGLSVAEIARRLHVSDVSVRAWLKKTESVPVADPRQMRLF
ncbi:MAG: helix-turn-helix domain-containing protein [Rhodobacterales bacterium]|nr:helix-turn-helix domain-containing protein [Rhodobacterales bacterium]